MNSRSFLLLLVAVCAVGSAAAWRCHKPDGTCINKRHVCFKGFIYRTPSGCDCHGTWPCEQRRNGGKCPLKNYQCIDDSHFCLAGIKMSCADGTWCRTTNNPHISPCNLTKPPRHQKCLAEGRCVGKHGYCEDGKVVKCGAGWECLGKFGPCVCPAV